MSKTIPHSDFYREKISSLSNLPTLPGIASEIVQATRSDDLSVNQLLPIIEKDPPLAIKVLKVANSAYYTSTEDVLTLQQAVVRIGMKELNQLAISFSILKAFSFDEQNTSLNWKCFWEHSAACGHIAELLDKKLDLRISENPYSLGLLHDIGKLVLHRLDSNRYIEAVEHSQENNLNSLEGERDIFGITHEDAGRWIAEKWKLPKALTHSIGSHHHPSHDNEGYRDSVALIQIADFVSNFNFLEFGSGYVHTVPRDESGWQILQENHHQLKEIDFEHFVMSIQDELDEIKLQVKMVKS